MRHRSTSQLRSMTERSMKHLLNYSTRGLCRTTLTRHRQCGSTLPWSRTGHRSCATGSSTFTVTWCVKKNAQEGSWTAWSPSTMAQLATFTSTLLLRTQACIWPTSANCSNPNSWYQFWFPHPRAPTTFTPSLRVATTLSSNMFTHSLHG